MPTYRFNNLETNEEFDVFMPYSELTDYIKNNPQFEQVLVLNIGDAVNMGVTQPPRDFQKYVLGKVKEMPGADKCRMDKRWVVPKEV